MSQPPTTPRRPEPTNPELIDQLQRRILADLSASFDPGLPLSIGYAPARIEVMGNITDYCGSKFVAIPANVGTAVAIQKRADKQISIFSFNLFDQHKPFTLIAPLRALTSEYKSLRNEFAQPGRTWAGYVAGIFAVLHQEKRIDLNQLETGFNIAILGDVPMSMGLGSSASLIAGALNAIESAMGLSVENKAALCMQVENQVIGLGSGPMDFATISPSPGTPGEGRGEDNVSPSSSPHPNPLPAYRERGLTNFQFIAITTGKEHPIQIKDHQRFRSASFIAHKLILEKMKQYGHAAGRQLIADPMHGLLANLSLDDYRKYFRSYVHEEIKGGHFLLEFGKTIDTQTMIEPDYLYQPQKAADFHIFGANRIKNLITCLNQSDQPHELRKAGHLLNASHISYRDEALVYDPNCDQLVDLVKQYDHAGIHGAKITGHGGGIVVLCDRSSRAEESILDIMQKYKDKTGLTPTRINPWL